MGSSRAATAAGRRSSAAGTGRGRAGRNPAPAAKPPARSRVPSKPGARRKRAAPEKPRARGLRRARSKLSTSRARRRRTRTAAAGRASRWRARVAILAALAICFTAGYFLWLRDSSLVAVTDVEVVGVRSGERARIVTELTAAAEGMTTLHVDRGELDRIGARFSTVASLNIDPNFPHGLRIEVSERPPALLARSAGEHAAIAADGSVLAGVEVPEGLPSLEVERLPAAGRLQGADLEQALVAGAAPAPLAPLIEAITETDDYGVEVRLRGGIPVRFGDASRVEDKWAAAAAVLADPKLTALTYLDVRVPERPVGPGP